MSERIGVLIFLLSPQQSDARNSDLLATTGDILRIWELVDDPRYGQSNSINSSSRANNNPNRHMQQLVKKAELVNVMYKKIDRS